MRGLGGFGLLVGLEYWVKGVLFGWLLLVVVDGVLGFGVTGLVCRRLFVNVLGVAGVVYGFVSGIGGV